MKLVINAINRSRDSFGTLHVHYKFTDIKTGEYYSYYDYFDEGSHSDADTKWMLKKAKEKAEKDVD